MKSKRLLVYLSSCLAVLFITCKNNHSPEQASSENKADTLIYYPINQYIRNQLIMLENSPVQPYKIYISAAGKDSTNISKEEVNELAQMFLNDSITALGTKEKYTEDIFQDQTTASYTFSYTSKDTLLPIQRIMVLLDTATQQVKNIIYNITRSYPDSTVTEMLWWKNNKGFTILQQSTLPGGTEQKRQLQVGWNNEL